MRRAALTGGSRGLLELRLREEVGSGRASPSKEGGDDVDEIKEALDKLEKCLARRKARQSFNAVISAAQAHFLDAAAIAAGAEDGEFYSRPALMARETMANREEVVQVLHEAWLVITQVIVGPAFKRSNELRASDDTSQRLILTRENYDAFFRKAYLYVAEQNHDTQINVDECVSRMDADWQADTDNQGDVSGMDEVAFKRCIFQLADLNTQTVACEEYVAYVRGLIDAVTKPVHAPGSPQTTRRSSVRCGRPADRVWRPDVELLSRIQSKVALPMRDGKPHLPNGVDAAGMRNQIFMPRRKSWLERFSEPKPLPRVASAPALPVVTEPLPPPEEPPPPPPEPTIKEPPPAEPRKRVTMGGGEYIDPLATWLKTHKDLGTKTVAGMWF